MNDLVLRLEREEQRISQMVRQKQNSVDINQTTPTATNYLKDAQKKRQKSPLSHEAALLAPMNIYFTMNQEKRPWISVRIKLIA
ncbi:uncharacterized protein TrAtP1_001918 [Trichoderma atroviride]|uniref:uncharacterized protein n=1 Tax=Hypocrea atroviridis TaxID=63577 RepID=UPI003327A86E|nr:hypothetical protein TrAtP1_001918 [Trichoderma atroviride]